MGNPSPYALQHFLLSSTFIQHCDGLDVKGSAVPPLRSDLTIFAYPINLISMRTEARLFKALADETRLKILWLLMNQEELCVAEIEGVLDIAQSRASRHLQTLSRAGLVTGRRDRFCVYYRISAGPETREGKLLEVLREMLSGQPFAESLRKWFQRWFDLATCQTPHRIKELAKSLGQMPKDF